MRVGNKGRVTTAATRYRMDRQRATYRRRIEAAFGTLTDRELALVKIALVKGYQKGYYVARGDNQRAEAA